MPDLNNLFQNASTVGDDSSSASWLVIDHDFRTISIPANKQLLGVTSDERVNILSFKAPRYYEGSDLSTFAIRAVYLNARGEGDLYLFDDVEAGDDELTFSWTVGRHACLYSGNVRFIISAVTTDENGYILQKYNTQIHTLPVVQGLETETEVYLSNYDVITQFFANIQRAQTVDQYVSDAEAYSIGTRGGIPVEEGDPAYHNNAKYYADQLSVIQDAASDAEAWAVGTRGGMPVAASDETYHNNSKYYLNAVVNELGTKVSALYDSTSGTVAEYHDGADGLSLRSTRFTLRPVQDLRGFDHPWLGGIEKNKLGITLTERTIGGMTASVNDRMHVVLNGMSDSICYFPVNNVLDTTALAGLVFHVNAVEGVTWRIGSASSTDATQELEDGDTVDDNGTGLVLYCRIANGLIFDHQVLSPMLLSASESDTSFSPYENSCDILGHSSITVHHTNVVPDESTIPEDTVAGFEHLAPIYGGAIDISKGTADVDYVKVSALKSDFGPVVTSLLGYNYHVASLPNSPLPKENGVQLCNHTIIADPNAGTASGEYVACVYYDSNQESPEIRISDAAYQLLADDDTLDICYETAEAARGEFAAVFVESYRGDNYVWIDEGPIAIEYPVDLLAYIDEKIQEHINEASNG